MPLTQAQKKAQKKYRAKKKEEVVNAKTIFNEAISSFEEVKVEEEIAEVEEIDIFISKYKKSTEYLFGYDLYNKYRFSCNKQEVLGKREFYTIMGKHFKKRMLMRYNPHQGKNVNKLAYLVEKI